jgi:hypothetical protein
MERAMRRPSRACAGLVLLLLGSGCLGIGDADTDAETAGEDDGSLAWLLPAAAEVPEGYALSANANVSESNPGPPSADAMRFVAIITGSEKAPSEAIAVRYEHTRYAREVVAVIAMRFEAPQQAADWRASDSYWPDPEATEPLDRADPDGASDDDEGGFEFFYSVCGLRPFYGFLRGNDAVVVTGGSGEEVDPDRVYRAASDLSRALTERSGGTDLCTALERQVTDRMYGTGDTPEGATRRDDAEPISPFTQRGPLAPGKSNWFASYPDDGACFVVSTEGRPLEVIVEDNEGEAIVLDWQERTAEDSWLTFAPLKLADRVLIRVTAPEDGPEVPYYAIGEIRGDCGPLLEDADPDDATGTSGAATSTSSSTSSATFPPPDVEPLVEANGRASIRHGPLAPGETQWFSFDAVGPHSCVYMGFRGQMGTFDLTDASGLSVDHGWGADRRDGAYGFNQDLYASGRFFLQVQAYPEGTGVDELWVELTPGDCPLGG